MGIETTTIVMGLAAIILIALIMAVMHISAKSDEMCKILNDINGQLKELGKDSSPAYHETKQPNPPAAKHGDWTCKSCGTKNDSNSSFCKDCGEYK